MKKIKLNEELFNNIIRMARLLKGEVASIPSTNKFTVLQLEILVFLYKEEKIKSSDVAKYFHVTKSTTSSHIDKLEKMRLIKRIKAKKDKRIDWIELTAKGERLLDKNLKERRAKFNKLLRLISGDEKKQLLNIIKNLVKTLENKA